MRCRERSHAVCISHMREILLKSFTLKVARASIYNNKTQQLKLPRVDYNRYWSSYGGVGPVSYTIPTMYAYTTYTTMYAYTTYTTHTTYGTGNYTLSNQY